MEQRPSESRIDPTVFYVSLVVVLAFLAWGVLFTDNVATVTGAVLSYVMTNFGWVFILSTLSFLAFMLYLAFSRYGSIRLGGDDERPEFRTVSWIAMMFSAGMGIGLMFFGVAEPMYHFGAPRTAWRKPTPRGPPRRRCSTRTSTGPSTRGPSTPSSPSPSRTLPFARGRPTSSARLSGRSWVAGWKGGRARRSIPWRSSPPSSGPAPRWDSAPCRDHAASEVIKGIYSNTGQYCDAGSRLLAEESIRGPLVDKILRRAREITLGPGMENPDMGPLVSAEHFDRVMGYVEAGRSEGANLIIGGRATDFDKGYFVSPTVFDGVSGEMSIAREEIFGPVLSVLPFSGDEEAAEIANDSNYGLAAGIFTSDIDRAMRFARDIQAGYVMVNEYFTGGAGSPFGGYKQSGIGRERGLLALQNYTQVKNVVVRVGRNSPGPQNRG